MAPSLRTRDHLRRPLPCPSLLGTFCSGDGVDMIRESVRAALQKLVEFETVGVIDAQDVRNTPGKGGQVVSMAVVVATGIAAVVPGRSSDWTSGTARTKRSVAAPCSAPGATEQTVNSGTYAPIDSGE